jgi:putative transposase
MAKPAGTTFVTLTTYEHRPVFQISRLAELLIDTLLVYRREGRYKLHAFLVLPDRVHLMLTPQLSSLAEGVAFIQNGFSRRVGSRHTLWDVEHRERSVDSLRDLETLRTYLHQIPVRANLAPAAELYPYSSAHHIA